MIHTTTYYRLDDLVKFGSLIRLQLESYTSYATTDDFYKHNLLDIYSEGLQFEDSYNASIYSKGDVVTHGGYSYVYIERQMKRRQDKHCKLLGM